MRSIVTVSALSGATVLAGMVLTNPSAFSESATTSANTSVTVAESCSLSTTGASTEYSRTVQPGSTTEITGSTLKAICNDAGGLAVYAIGFGGDTAGETSMLMFGGNSSYSIATGTATSGGTSAWAMKLTSGTGSPSILAGYSAYSVIPNTQTKVLSYGSGTSATSGVQATASYRVYAAPAQAAGTYIGEVKYTMVHPQSAPAPGGGGGN